MALKDAFGRAGVKRKAAWIILTGAAALVGRVELRWFL